MNYYVSLAYEYENPYYGSLNLIVKSFYNRLISRNGNKIKSDTENFADTSNRISVNKGNTLKIDKYKEFLVETNDTLDSVLKAVKK